jgi:serine/threonine protein kinase
VSDDQNLDTQDILLVHGNRKRRIQLKPGQPTIIGRSPDADFFLNATSVSRRHCAITLSSGEVHAEDLGSRNSCFINEEKIKKAKLSDGVILQLGKISFQVEFVKNVVVTCNRCGAFVPESEINAEGVIVCPQCWSVIEIGSTNNVWDGLESEGFRVISLLSQDPQVFKAERIEIGKIYRVKVLPLREDQDSSVIDQFLKEARLAASLVHDNIFQVFDFRRCPGIIYVVMEFQDGQTLAEQVIENGPLDPEDGIALARELCEAIAYANERDLVHGNINPQVVFVTDRGVAKLMDFSLAREINALSGTFDIEPGQGGDTIMAPEIYTAINKDAIDVRADFYGLGLTLHYALTGHSAFPGITGLEMAMKLSRGEMPVPEMASVPEHLIPFIEKLLAGEPDKRPATVGEVREELKWLEKSGNSDDLILDSVGSESAIFTGTISSNELVEFVQMVELHGKTGMLVVKGERNRKIFRGTVRFRDGRIIEAKNGKQAEAVAARTILGSRQGKFSFTPQEPDKVTAGKVNLHVSALLMELAREQDESGIF